jgi:hypothetical protein
MKKPKPSNLALLPLQLGTHMVRTEYDVSVKKLYLFIYYYSISVSLSIYFL